MKKLFFVWLLIFGIATAKAQLTMTLQVPPSGLLLKSQLWNMLLTNSGTTVQVYLSVTLSDIATGDQVLTAVTSSFLLNTGTRQLMATDLTIQYNYLSAVVTDQDPNGVLPVGNYEACYTLNPSGHVGTPLQDCITLTIEPISPPLLNIPFDESTAESRSPQFNWLPPAPMNMFSNLTYDLVLVEVQNGQLAMEAIQQNIPILYVSGNTNIFLNYPSSNMPLDTSKLYAWQIIAKNNEQYAAQSEVWTFRVREDSIAPATVSKHSYIKLKRQPDGSITTCHAILKFNYNNEADDSTVNYRISSLTEADLGNTVKEGALQVGFGENYIDIELTGDNKLIEHSMYLLELFNSRNESWSMKFLYLQTPEEEPVINQQ